MGSTISKLHYFLWFNSPFYFFILSSVSNTTFLGLSSYFLKTPTWPERKHPLNQHARLAKVSKSLFMFHTTVLLTTKEQIRAEDNRWPETMEYIFYSIRCIFIIYWMQWGKLSLTPKNSNLIYVQGNNDNIKVLFSRIGDKTWQVSLWNQNRVLEN